MSRKGRPPAETPLVSDPVLFVPGWCICRRDPRERAIPRHGVGVGLGASVDVGGRVGVGVRCGRPGGGMRVAVGIGVAVGDRSGRWTRRGSSVACRNARWQWESGLPSEQEWPLEPRSPSEPGLALEWAWQSEPLVAAVGVNVDVGMDVAVGTEVAAVAGALVGVGSVRYRRRNKRWGHYLSGGNVGVFT